MGDGVDFVREQRDVKGGGEGGSGESFSEVCRVAGFDGGDGGGALEDIAVGYVARDADVGGDTDA